MAYLLAEARTWQKNREVSKKKVQLTDDLALLFT